MSHHSTLASLFARRRFRKALGALIFVAVFLGVIIVPIERGTGNIRSFEEGLWWASTTASGVGYGDFYPVTMLGRLIGVVLQFTGVLTFGVIIGFIGMVTNKRQEDLYWAREFERFNLLEKKLEGIEKKLQYLVFEESGQEMKGSPEEAQSNRE